MTSATLKICCCSVRVAKYGASANSCVRAGAIGLLLPPVSVSTPAMETVGGMVAGSTISSGMFSQSIATRLRTDCVYPSTRGNRISNSARSGSART